MKLSLYIDDRETEKIFSYLRWVFLIVGVLIFYFPPLANRLDFTEKTFPILLSIGIFYMAVTQIALARLSKDDRYFPILTRTGIVFDFIAIMWLLALTRGIQSPLFPIAYLMIMHSTIYWRTKGALYSSIALTIGYSILYAVQGDFEFYTSFLFVLNIAFIWIIGIFGSLIVIRERKHFKQKELFQELMFTDYLTGLYNHRHFQEQMRLLATTSTSFLLVMGDIDFFKSVNDRFGHLTGDKVLKNIGKIFKDLEKNYDAQAFRYGGEEFAFLLPHMEDKQIIQFFTDLYAELAQEKYSEECGAITMSFGIASSITEANPDRLLNLTDKLLYKAKENGKNQVKFESGFTFRFRPTTVENEIASSRE